jgi:hypothetical protein
VGLFRNAKETRKVDAGAVIFNEGDKGAEMFGIIDGEVELRAKDGVLGRLGPEDIFGEMALIDDSPRSLTGWPYQTPHWPRLIVIASCSSCRRHRRSRST